MQADLLAQLEQQLAAANARVQQLESTLAACREAGFIREDGTVRCQKTVDGVALKPGDDLYAVDPCGYIEELTLKVCFYGTTNSSMPSTRYYLDDCFSTREAAEAARGGGGR